MPNLKEYFNKMPRLGTLSTASKDGKVNAAYFMSVQMADKDTVTMACGDNRTFANLQENPNAVFLIMEPGKTLQDWKGIRVYLKMTECLTSGEKFEKVRVLVTKMAGEDAAKNMRAAITFTVQELRPLADFGQGWERSI
jgi:hypothetical protein